jgi:hypothetical protein
MEFKFQIVVPAAGEDAPTNGSESTRPQRDLYRRLDLKREEIERRTELRRAADREARTLGADKDARNDGAVLWNRRRSDRRRDQNT